MPSLACDGASVPTPDVARSRRLEGGPSCWRVQDPEGLGRPLAGHPSVMAARPLALQWLKARTHGSHKAPGARAKERPRTEKRVDRRRKAARCEGRKASMAAE